MMKSRKKRSKKLGRASFSKERKLQLLVTLIFAVLLGSLTVGYAAKSYLIKIGGRVDFEIAGKMFIKDAQLTQSLGEVTVSPAMTDETITPHFSFHHVPNAPNPMMANLQLTIRNDLPFRRCFYLDKYDALMQDNDGRPAVVDFEMRLLSADASTPAFNHCLDAGTETQVTLQAKMGFSSSQAAQDFYVKPDIKTYFRYSGEESGEILAYVGGDELTLERAGELKSFMLYLVNTGAAAKEVTVSIPVPFAVALTDSPAHNTVNGGTFSFKTVVPEHTSRTVQVYADLDTSETPGRPMIFLEPEVIDDTGRHISTGKVKLRFKQDIVHTDNDAPTISGVDMFLLYGDSLSPGEDRGDIKLVWNAQDVSPIESFKVNVKYRKDPNAAYQPFYEANLDEYQILDSSTGKYTVGASLLNADHRKSLPAGDYVFTITGQDIYQNVPNADALAHPAAKPGPGSVIRIETKLRWRIPIDWKLSHVKPVGQNYVMLGGLVDETFIPDKAWYNATHTKLYGRYPEIEATHVFVGPEQGGTELVNNAGGQIVYSYNQDNGKIYIKANEAADKIRPEELPAVLTVRSEARVCWIGWSDV